MLIGGNYSYSNGRNLQYDTFWQIFCIHTFFVRNSGCLGLTECCRRRFGVLSGLRVGWSEGGTAELLPKYQHIIGCLLYLAIFTRSLFMPCGWVNSTLLQCAVTFSLRSMSSDISLRPNPLLFAWVLLHPCPIYSARLYPERGLLWHWLGIWCSWS